MRTRTHTILAAVLVAALFTLSTLGATPAAAQAPDPVVGVGYDLMNAGGVKLHGAAVDYDRPIHGDYVRLAAGGAFVTGSFNNRTVNHLFAGAGPGVRYDTGTLQIYAHALFGYRRDDDQNRRTGNARGFDGRFGGGIDYPLGEGRNFRAGIDYGGNVHLTVGMSFRF